MNWVDVEQIAIDTLTKLAKGELLEYVDVDKKADIQLRAATDLLWYCERKYAEELQTDKEG